MEGWGGVGCGQRQLACWDLGRRKGWGWVNVGFWFLVCGGGGAVVWFVAWLASTGNVACFTRVVGLVFHFSMFCSGQHRQCDMVHEGDGPCLPFLYLLFCFFFFLEHAERYGAGADGVHVGGGLGFSGQACRFSFSQDLKLSRELNIGTTRQREGGVGFGHPGVQS